MQFAHQWMLCSVLAELGEPTENEPAQGILGYTFSSHLVAEEWWYIQLFFKLSWKGDVRTCQYSVYFIPEQVAQPVLQ